MKTLNKLALMLTFVGLTITSTGQTINCGSISPTALIDGLSTSPHSGVGSGTFYDVTLSGNWTLKNQSVNLNAITNYVKIAKAKVLINFSLICYILIS